jgi:hypothetical protein
VEATSATAVETAVSAKAASVTTATTAASCRGKLTVSRGCRVLCLG